jgi:hypothetical protein
VYGDGGDSVVDEMYRAVKVGTMDDNPLVVEKVDTSITPMSF